MKRIDEKGLKEEGGAENIQKVEEKWKWKNQKGKCIEEWKNRRNY